jgi:sulfoxide reductase heme-binding subunit YedZ
MEFIPIFIIVVVFSLIFKNAIKKYPAVFYLIAIVLSVLFYLETRAGVIDFPDAIKNGLRITMQRGTLGMAFFVLVMYIGVFDRSSRIRGRLGAIRGELSIIACLLIIGHVVFYAVSYLPLLTRLSSAGAGYTLFSVIICGAILVALLVVLGITSIKRIRKAMRPEIWKRIQRWSYLFYLLTYVHVVATLLPSALANGAVARVQIIMYTVIFGLYLVLRVRRAILDHNTAQLITGGTTSGGRSEETSDGVSNELSEAVSHETPDNLANAAAQALA